MRRLGQRERLLRRRGFDAPPRRSPVRVVSCLVLAGLGFGLLFASRADVPMLRDAREGMISVAAPVLQLARAPLEPLRVLGRQFAFVSQGERELERLRGEIQELRGWKWRAKDLERRLADLEALARVVNRPALRFVTGQVLAVAPDLFSNSVTIGVGRRDGVSVGHAVINGDGLVGIVTQVAHGVARVRLLNDAASRLDVALGPERLPGTLVGGKGRSPGVVLPADSLPVADGALIVTSGREGRLPRGLRVGRVARSTNGLVAVLAVDERTLDYVSVLFHNVPITDVPAPVAGPSDAGGTPAPARTGTLSEVAQ